MRAVKSVSIDSERRVIITFLDGSTETLYPNCIWCDAEALKEIIKELLEEKADAIVQTINNVAVASFEDGADEALIRKLLVSIDPIQEGTGVPSPENVRPISGRSGLTVSHSGADTSDPATISVNWEAEAGTVYGGTLDVVNGKLTVNRVSYVLDGVTNKASDLSQYPQDSQYVNLRELYRVTVFDLPDGAPYNADNISSHFNWYKYKGRYNALPDSLITGSASGVINWVSSSYTTLEEFNGYLADQYSAGTPVTLVYELGAPISYDITPQDEITTFLGTNNIWADSGNILELEYVADTKLYIGESQSGTLGSGRQTISSPDIQPVSEKTLEDLCEVGEKETQEETEDERGE